MDNLSWSILADPFLHEPVQRYEGVGKLLDPVMATAWRNSGECWRTISSRIVSIHMQLQGCTFCGVNRHYDSGVRIKKCYHGNTFLTANSVYVELGYAYSREVDVIHNKCTKNWNFQLE